MSHDVDLEFEDCDITLSFTLPGKFVYVFAYHKHGGPDSFPVVTRAEWDQMTMVVHDNLRLPEEEPTHG